MNLIRSIQKRYVIGKLRLSAKFNKTKGVIKPQNRQPQVIVSLTSFPARFSSVLLTLESLLNQTIKPNKILLWLAEGEARNNLHIFNKVEKRGVEICLTNENLKSYKKLVYAYEKYPDDIIITCDDDKIYPRTLIKDLMGGHERNPNCIVAFFTKNIPVKERNEFSPYSSWTTEKKEKISAALMPIGVGGVLYPPNSLHADVSNKELFMRLAPNADDIWFKAMSMKNGLPVFNIGKSFKNHITIKGSQNTRLSKKNIKGGGNDQQFRAVFGYYDLYRLLDNPKK